MSAPALVRVLGCRLAAALLALGVVATPAGAQVHSEAQVKAQEPPLVAQTFADRGDGVLWEGRVEARGSAYMRLHFAEISAPPGLRYSVVVRSEAGRALARYTPEQLARKPDFYSDVLFVDVAKVQVEGTPPLAGFSFKIDHLLHEIGLQGRLTPQSTVANWKDPAELRGRALAAYAAYLEPLESVAKLFIGSGIVCSGFLVGAQVLLTNFHCLVESPVYGETKSQATPDCSDIAVHFDFDQQVQPDKVARTRCARVVSADPDLDYALLGLETSPKVGGRARRALVLSPRALTAPEEVFIVHHPGGLAKKVSFRCTAYPGPEPRVEHDCSTIGGSSGAPVITLDGRVIGLHQEGPYSRSMTIGMIEELIKKGAVFRNKAEPAERILERVRGFLP